MYNIVWTIPLPSHSPSSRHCRPQHPPSPASHRPLTRVVTVALNLSPRVTVAIDPSPPLPVILELYASKWLSLAPYSSRYPYLNTLRTVQSTIQKQWFE